jgi:pimeloyl-ACP methyl ester carboxylesterase
MKTSSSFEPKSLGFAKVNGIELYYEIYGSGEPLFFLHGYTQSSKAWKEYVEEYSKEFEVYLVDLRGHGKSGVCTEKFSLKKSAKDILELLRHLKIEKTKAIGMSFGGDVLLQLAAMSPGLLESMIVIGSNGDWDAQDFPEMLKEFTFERITKPHWIYEFQPGGDEQVKAIVDELANYKFHLSDAEIKNITAKTLLVLGDRDGQISVESVVRLNGRLGNSQLWIVPNTSHYAHDGDNRNEFLRISKRFFMEIEGEK